MTNPIIDSLPAVAEIDALLDAERGSESRVTQKAGKVRSEYAAAHARWESDAIEAELSGHPVPDAPAEPDLTISTRAVERVRANIERLIRDRQRAIADAADEVHEQAYAELAALVDEARPHLEALQALLPRARAATTAVDTVADARQATDPRQRTYQRRVDAVSVSALIALVSAGPGALLEGRDPRAERVLGFQYGEPGRTSDARSTVTESPAAGQSVTVVRTSKGAES